MCIGACSVAGQVGAVVGGGKVEVCVVWEECFRKEVERESGMYLAFLKARVCVQKSGKGGRCVVVGSVIYKRGHAQ